VQNIQLKNLGINSVDEFKNLYETNPSQFANTLSKIQHLLPKQLKEHGLSSKHLTIGKKQLEKIVEGYTRESGVRSLEQKIAQVIRNAAKSVAMEESYNKKVTDQDIVKVLGVPRLERDKYENNDVAGVVTGLAWTSVGGDILFIESLISKGKGTMTITGNLGTVMKESATIALEYIKSNADIFGIDPELLSNNLDSNDLMEQCFGLFTSILVSHPKFLFDIKKYTVKVRNILIFIRKRTIKK
jgi:hypothetical protein